MSKLIRLMIVVGLAALWFESGSTSAQSPNTYTSIVVTDITSGAPVVGGIFTTNVNVSVANSGGTPTAIQGVEVYIGFDPTKVRVLDFDNNLANGIQVEIRTGFFTSMQTGINRVEGFEPNVPNSPPCPAAVGRSACVHIAVSQITGGVTNGSGPIAAIRWNGIMTGTAGLTVAVPPSTLSDPNGLPVPINNASAPSITIGGPGTIVGVVTRQGRTADGHAGSSVSALNAAGSVVAGPVTTAANGTFVSPLAVPAGGTYLVIASYPGYLSAQKSNVYVVGATVDIGPTQLRGGEVNGDNCVNILDLVTIASWFSQSSPPAPGAIDINDDLVVNVLDLTIGASNFSRCGLTTW